MKYHISYDVYNDLFHIIRNEDNKIVLTDSDHTYVYSVLNLLNDENLLHIFDKAITMAKLILGQTIVDLR